MSNKSAEAAYPIHELIKNRWSPRAFADKPVALDVIKSVLEAARWAASCFNEQPWRFIVGIKGQNDSYTGILDSLVEFNQNWAKNAPVLILACGKKVFTHNQKPNRHFSYDVGQAAASLSLQAMAENLYVHQMAGFSPDKAREFFDIPEDYEAITTMAMGYLGDPDILDEKSKASELGTRARRPLSEICFGDGWEKAL